MKLYNMTVYNNSTKNLSAQAKDVGKYIATLSTDMNQIQSTAQSWLNQTSPLTAAQTNITTNLSLITSSLNALSGLNKSMKDFIQNWNSNKNILNSDLNQLNSFLQGNWITYNNKLNTALTSVQTIISNITSANSTLTNLLSNTQIQQLISTQVSNGQTTNQLLTALQGYQSNITSDISAWNSNYQVLMSALGNSQTGIPSSISKLVSATVTPDVLNQVVSALTNASLSSTNLSNVIGLSQQFVVWNQYFSSSFGTVIANANNDIAEFTAGNTSMTATQIRADMQSITSYVTMLYNLSNYWAAEITLAASTMQTMNTQINTIGIDVNKMLDVLNTIIKIISNVLGQNFPGLDLTQVHAQLITVSQNLQLYGTELQDIAAGVSAEKSNTSWLWMVGVGAVAIIGAFAWIWYKAKKGGKTNG
ncbi:MAG: hypothetical protein QXV17_03610 [Candidatus Micrarchaeaceae archaeon]